MRLLMLFSLMSLMGFVFLPFLIEEAHAQVFQLEPEPPITPVTILSLTDASIPKSSIIDSLDSSLKKPSLAVKEQAFSINLLIVSLSKKQTTFTYHEADALAQWLSKDAGDAWEFRRKDLPSTLFQESVGIALPIPIGDDSLTVSGEMSLATDKKDISSEDYNSDVSIGYSLNPEESTAYRFGVAQNSSLGFISPLSPLAEVAFNREDYQLAVGAAVFAKRVVPSVRLNWKTEWQLMLEITVPDEVTLSTKFLENWYLNLAYRQRGDLYRLTEKAPWKSAVFSKSDVQSKIEIGYHLFGTVLLQVGMGQLSNREYEISKRESIERTKEKESDKITKFTVEDKPFQAITVSFALLPDSEFGEFFEDWLGVF